MRLLWTKSAKESYDLLKADAPEIAEKVKSILKDTIAHPDSGSGSPTRLEREYSNLWQRTYAPGQVIIYSVHEEAVTIISIGARETAIQKVRLESYSNEEEQSVMSQMAANRGKDHLFRDARGYLEERILQTTLPARGTGSLHRSI